VHEVIHGIVDWEVSLFGHTHTSGLLLEENQHNQEQSITWPAAVMMGKLNCGLVGFSPARNDKNPVGCSRIRLRSVPQSHMMNVRMTYFCWLSLYNNRWWWWWWRWWSQQDI